MTDNLLVLSSDTVWGILLRFAINLIFIIVLVGVIYFRYTKKEKFLFTFFLIGIVVFFVSAIMKRIDIGVGLAFDSLRQTGIIKT
jgi:glucose uptake protein GlcU